MIAKSLFVSHGAPDLLVTSCPAQDFLSDVGRKMKRPDAIIVISAHYLTDGLEVTSSDAPETIHDFWGFDPKLYELKYEVPGAGTLARAIKSQLQEQGLGTRLNTKRGLDHGAWVPLKLMFPQADIPVVQLSLNQNQDAAWHYRVGQMLKPLLKKNILLMGSGSLTHNLNAYSKNRGHIDSPTPQWASSFNDWVYQKISEGDLNAIINALNQGPHAKDNHPTAEHFLPFTFALGAGEISSASRIHQSYTYGALSMDAYKF